MNSRLAACGIAAILVTACGGESHQDLRAWMQDQGKGMRGKLDPLPQVRPYEPFTYNAFDLADPFKPRKIEPVKGGSKLAPDLNRRKEPLEAYPVDSMAMVGSVVRAGRPYALLKVDNLLYQVKPGDYLGQNYGKITKISETNVAYREIVQDAAGEWIERNSALQLQEKAR